MKTRKISFWLISALLAMTLATGCAKGPGTQRADADVAADVQAKINSDANLPNKAITVNANNGTVTLSGTVATETERLAAANDAGQVDGVKTVVNNLQVSGTTAGTTLPPAMPAGNSEPGNVRSAPARRSAPATAPRVATATPAGSSGMASSPAAPAAEAKVTVPSGTELSVRTNDEISSEKVEVGEKFTATLDSPVYVGENIVIPAHADVSGRVVDVKSAGKFAGRSELVLQLTGISYNGRNYALKTNQWQKAGASRGKNTAAKVGGGAAVGAVIGAIAGGGKGAAIGAGVGAGAGTGVQAMTKSEQIVLRPETILTFTLENPVTVVPASANQSTRRPMTNNQ
jgi:hypothetical protein